MNIGHAPVTALIGAGTVKQMFYKKQNSFRAKH